MENKIEKQLPVGKPQGIRKEYVPAVDVRNHVTYVNSDFEESMPFKMEMGKPAKLGLFFRSGDSSFDEEWKRNHVLGNVMHGELPNKQIEVNAAHHRTGVIGRALFRDKQGNIFRDVDLKGLGYFFKFKWDGKYEKSTPTTANPRIKDDTTNKDALGILNLDDAKYDRTISDIFTKLGIRCHRVVGIIVLDEIVIEEYINNYLQQRNIKISVEEAKKRNILPKNSMPVIAVRAFKTKLRLADVTSGNKEIIEDAKTLVAQELGKKPENFDYLQFAQWFAKTMGKNIGLMHENGYAHGYLYDLHNITLDGGITDFDSVSKPTDNNKKANFGFDYDCVKKKVAYYGRLLSDLYFGKEVVTQEDAKKREPIYKELKMLFEKAYNEAKG